MTQCIVGLICFGVGWSFLKDWITAQPPHRIVADPARTPAGRDDAVYSLVGVVSGLCVVMWLQKTGSRLAGRDDAVYSLVGVVSGLCVVMWLQKTGSRVKPVMTRFYCFTFLLWGCVVVSKRLDHGSQAVMTQCIVWFDLFRGRVVVSKRLGPGSQAGMTRL